MKRFIIHYIMVITILTSIISCVFLQKEVDLGYNILWIQPTVFLFMYQFIYVQLIRKGQYKVTLYSFIFLAWIRCVVIPFGSSISGVYNGVSYIQVGEDSVKLAILLTAYELILTSLFMYYIVNKKTTNRNNESIDDNLTLSGNKFIYALFILLGVIMYIFIGRKEQLVDFFIISASAGGRRGDLDSTSLVLVREIITTAFLFFFVWYASYAKKKVESTGKSIYVNLAIAVGVLNIGLIIGERRTNQLYSGLVVLFILTRAFAKYRKRIITIVSTAAVTVLLFMTIYKHFNAFVYGSYYDSISNSNIDLGWLTTQLQSYFYDTQNTAITIDFARYANLNITNMLYDFGRSTFGLSFLFKGNGVLTSELFNTFIYGIPTATGHLISGLGYGYIYLGAVLSPTIVVINILVSIGIEKWFNKTNTFEMKYIVGIMLVRFSTSIISNTPPLISQASMTLFTSGLVYFVAKTFRKTQPDTITNKLQKNYIKTNVTLTN